MILGTSSGAGKSWLTTALCRWYARRGLRVAPFKAQNMSNNARVVGGPAEQLGEIGSAQYFQALAAGVQPEVRMNPILLKPEHDTASQVVLMGQVDRALSTMPWRDRSERLWPHALAALQSLRQDHELILIEGAGSPAEINLHDSDYVNMRTALAARAACLLVSDIDRGGAFAHLYGTHQLLPEAERALIKGFVLNRFRGDPALLAPGPAQLQALTGVPTLGVLPMLRDHGLPEEDGWYDVHANRGSRARGEVLRVAIVAYPRISNLDEFQPLRNLPQVRVTWARQAADLDGADWVILPGSKHTRADLAWLQAQGLDRAVRAHAEAGRPVLGICGGLQMLGRHLDDPHGVEGASPSVSEARSSQGLDLLPVNTRFAPRKSLWRTRARLVPRDGVTSPAPVIWHRLQGIEIDGYEIHHGESQWVAPDGPMDAEVRDAAGRVIGWQRGAVLGLYLHGLMESPAVLKALFGAQARTLDDVFDGLADVIDQHMDAHELMRLSGA